MMSEKRCGDCEYFVAFRNYNYETCTNDTITEYCDLLQNKETYDRDKGDEVWNSIFQDCPLQTGIIPVESAIKLLESRKFKAERFNDYVRHSCKETELLKNENEQLRQRIAFFEKQSDEFEQYTAQTIQNMIANYRDDE